MRNGNFRSPRAEHQQAKYPKGPVFGKRAEGGVFFIPRRQGVKGHETEKDSVCDGDDRPGAGDDFPIGNSEREKEQRGNENDEHASPTVKGMEESHGGLLLFRGAGFHERGYDHFDQSAAHCVQTGGNDESGNGIYQGREKSE